MLILSRAARRIAEVVTDGLAVHLDAGNIASIATGSTQTWEDLTSNGFDFFRGTSASSESSDPTINGTPGNLSSSEFLSYDGGDTGQAAAAYSGLIPRLIGRTDQPFSLEAWIYFANVSAQNIVFANVFDGSGKGIYWQMNSSGSDPGQMSMRFFDGAESPYTATGTAVANTTWTQIGFSGRPDGSTTCTHIVNGQSSGTFTDNNSGFSTGDSSTVATTSGRVGDTTARLNSGSRLAIFRVYDRVLSVNEFQENYNAQRGRFGI